MTSYDRDCIDFAVNANSNAYPDSGTCVACGEATCVCDDIDVCPVCGYDADCPDCIGEADLDDLADCEG